MKFIVSDKDYIELSRQLLACKKAQEAAAKKQTEIMDYCKTLSNRLDKNHTILKEMITGGPGHATDDQDLYLQACLCVEENAEVLKILTKKMVKP